MTDLRICVIGCGYLGATHAVAMAEMGYEVVGIDIDAEKIAALEGGRAPFFEPGLDALLAGHVSSGRIRFTSDLAAAAGSTAIFLCVGTPQAPGSNAADMRHVFGAADVLAEHLREPVLGIGKSTVPVGTAASLQMRLRSAAPGARPCTSPGTRSSSARATRWMTRCGPTGSSWHR